MQEVKNKKEKKIVSFNNIIFSSFLILVILSSGYFIIPLFLNSSNNMSVFAQMEGKAPQAMPVEITTIEAEKVTIWEKFSGRIAPLDIVQVRPQVSGRIDKILFKDGDIVQKGQSLFIIDTRPYQAAVNQAEAALSTARSQLSLANSEAARLRGLVNKDYVSKSLYDQKVNDAKIAQASIQAANAQLTQAKLNLEYAYVKAPISGKISRAEITTGNVVAADFNAPILTTIVANEKMYGEFDVDENTYLKIIRPKMQKGEIIPVKILLSDGTTKLEGKLHSFDNQINTNTGTMRARAVFDNSNDILIAGMYAKIQLATTDNKEKLLISEKALGTEQGSKFVMLVGKDNKVIKKIVELGATLKGKRVILSGIKSGDKVITSNLYALQPGMLVQPIDTQQKLKENTPQ